MKVGEILTINSCSFVFDGEDSLLDHSLILCDFEEPSSSNDEEVNIITNKQRGRDVWELYGLEYSNPLTFNITVCNSDFSYFTTSKQIETKKYLCRKEYKILTFNQDDLLGVNYFCIINFNEHKTIARNDGGLVFTVTCNSPYPWSDEITKLYTSNDTLTVTFNVDTGFQEYIVYPISTITSLADGNIEIINVTENNRTTSISGCTTNEEIVLNENKLEPLSSVRTLFIDSFNKNFLQLVEGDNTLTLNGNFSLLLKYRFPIRVGA